MKAGEPFNPYRRFRQNVLIPIGVVKMGDLDHGAKLLYGILRLRAGDKGFCFPGREHLGRMLGVSVSRVSEYTRQLREKGLIAANQRQGRKSNRYEFLWHPALEESPPEASWDKGPLLADKKPPSHSQEGPLPADENRKRFREQGSREEGTDSYPPGRESDAGASACSRLEVEDEDGASIAAHRQRESTLVPWLTAEAEKWEASLHLTQPILRVLAGLPDTPCLPSGLRDAAILHFRKDATRAVMNAANYWRKHKVPPATDPNRLSEASNILWHAVVAASPETRGRLRSIYDIIDREVWNLVCLMWCEHRGQPRPVWQRRAAWQFLEQDHAFDPAQFLEYFFQLFDCCQWRGPQIDQALLSKVERFSTLPAELDQSHPFAAWDDVLKDSLGVWECDLYFDVERYLANTPYEHRPRFPETYEFEPSLRHYVDQRQSRTAAQATG